jgi:hypothetical protein
MKLRVREVKKKKKGTERKDESVKKTTRKDGDKNNKTIKEKRENDFSPSTLTGHAFAIVTNFLQQSSFMNRRVYFRVQK